jgi:hypothetical protein
MAPSIDHFTLMKLLFPSQGSVANDADDDTPAFASRQSVIKFLGVVEFTDERTAGLFVRYVCRGLFLIQIGIH